MVKLNSFNGWQRLWLVGSVFALLYLAGWEPLEENQRQREVLNNLYSDARADFAAPSCNRYQTAAFASLAEPKGGEFKPGSCSHIWRHRSESSNPDLPYTEADFNKQFDESLSDHYRGHLLIGVVGSLIFSALAYIAGWVIAWVVRGFRRTK
jgi:hypothetical protein